MSYNMLTSTYLSIYIPLSLYKIMNKSKGAPMPVNAAADIKISAFMWVPLLPGALSAT